MTPATALTTTAGRDVCDRDALVERFNRVVRRPAEFGGLAEVARLLGRLAAGEPQGGEQVWIPDTNARLAPSMMFREGFSAPEIHVAASQYGEDAHRRGWLRLDRTLTAAEHSFVVDNAASWSENDRSLREIVAEFGLPSVTFGATDPDLPKTVSYAGDDRAAPVVAFHLGAAPSGADSVGDAVLLAVRVHDGFFGSGWEITPFGESLLD